MSQILDRTQYDPKMITNIEVMSAYFVDLYYNHLYLEGKKLKINGNVSSVTEGYKHALNAFIKSLSTPKLYKKAIIGIHQYFINYANFKILSFSKCVDKLSESFVPLDYYNSLNNNQKMSILRLVINQAIKNFTKKIVIDHLNKIIDNHKEVDNVRLLQDELIDCFLMEREGVYQRFVSSQTKTSSNETVNRLIAEKMQKEIKNLIMEKIQIKKRNKLLEKIIIKNNSKIKDLKKNKKNLEQEISDLNKKIKNLHNNSKSYINSEDSEDSEDSDEEINFEKINNQNRKITRQHNLPQSNPQQHNLPQSSPQQHNLPQSNPQQHNLPQSNPQQHNYKKVLFNTEQTNINLPQIKLSQENKNKINNLRKRLNEINSINEPDTVDNFIEPPNEKNSIINFDNSTENKSKDIEKDESNDDFFFEDMDEGHSLDDYF